MDFQNLIQDHEEVMINHVPKDIAIEICTLSSNRPPTRSWMWEFRMNNCDYVSLHFFRGKYFSQLNGFDYSTKYCLNKTPNFVIVNWEDVDFVLPGSDVSLEAFEELL